MRRGHGGVIRAAHATSNFRIKVRVRTLTLHDHNPSNHNHAHAPWSSRTAQLTARSWTANGVTGCRRSNLTTVTATCKSVQHSRYYYYLGARACQSEAHLQFLTRCAPPRPAHGRHGEPSRRVQHNAASSAGPTRRDSSSQKGGIHRLCIPATSLATLPLLECITASHPTAANRANVKQHRQPRPLGSKGNRGRYRSTNTTTYRHV